MMPSEALTADRRVVSYPDAHDSGGVRIVGSLYRQRGRNGRAGRIWFWWIKYYRIGKPIRESSGTTKETEARRVLNEREGRVATGQRILPHADRIRYEEIARDLRAHYRITGSRDLAEAEARLAHLDRFFAGRRVVLIGPADITAYVARRRSEDASNGTVNRDLAISTRCSGSRTRTGRSCGYP
jgi:hypothetical protein